MKKIVFAGNLKDRLGRIIPTFREIFDLVSSKKYPHTRENARRMRQIERGILRVKN